MPLLARAAVPTTPTCMWPQHATHAPHPFGWFPRGRENKRKKESCELSVETGPAKTRDRPSSTFQPTTANMDSISSSFTTIITTTTTTTCHLPPATGGGASPSGQAPALPPYDVIMAQRDGRSARLGHETWGRSDGEKKKKKEQRDKDVGGSLCGANLLRLHAAVVHGCWLMCGENSYLVETSCRYVSHPCMATCRMWPLKGTFRETRKECFVL